MHDPAIRLVNELVSTTRRSALNCRTPGTPPSRPTSDIPETSSPEGGEHLRAADAFETRTWSLEAWTDRTQDARGSTSVLGPAVEFRGVPS